VAPMIDCLLFKCATLTLTPRSRPKLWRLCFDANIATEIYWFRQYRSIGVNKFATPTLKPTKAHNAKKYISNANIFKDSGKV